MLKECKWKVKLPLPLCISSHSLQSYYGFFLSIFSLAWTIYLIHSLHGGDLIFAAKWLHKTHSGFMNSTSKESSKGQCFGDDCRLHLFVCETRLLKLLTLLECSWIVCILIIFYQLCGIYLSLCFSAVSPSDNSRTFGLSPVWPLETPSPKQANGDLRLGPHWRPQSPKSPKSPKVLRLSPQESRYRPFFICEVFHSHI